MREAGLGLKAATITPEGADDVGSPNRILREAVDGQVIVKTYRTVLDDYRTHPESKSLGPDGTPCDRQTVGLLTRRPVKLAAVHYIGKESNKIEEALSGLVADQDDVLTEYREPGSDPLWQLTSACFASCPSRRPQSAPECRSAPCSEPAPARPSARPPVRSSPTRPSSTPAPQLHAAGIPRPPDREALLATYLERQSTPNPEPQLCACGCGEPVPAGTRGRPRKYIDETHRKRAQRRQE
jgi:hypothetical protein